MYLGSRCVCVLSPSASFSPTLSFAAGASRYWCLLPSPFPFCVDEIAPRLLRCAHASRQLTATLGAHPQVLDTSLETWLLSGLEWDLRQKSALSCLHYWIGESCLGSEELERCTDLQVVQTALEIASHLPAAPKLQR